MTFRNPNSLGAPVDLRGDDVGGPLPARPLQDLADLGLRVGLRDVEQVDPALDGQLEDGLRLLIAHARREDGPGAQAHVGDPEAALAEILVPQPRRRRGAVPQRQRRIGAQADGAACAQRNAQVHGHRGGVARIQIVEWSSGRVFGCRHGSETFRFGEKCAFRLVRNLFSFSVFFFLWLRGFQSAGNVQKPTATQQQQEYANNTNAMPP